MNKLHSLGVFYFIIRDIGKKKDPVLSLGFMRQTGYPWKSGKGLQLRIGKCVIQFGLCVANKKVKEENEGLLYAMKGRLLEDKPGEIGNW